eukprot:COSAG01_NODE_1603_length_9758_cov_7.506471_3_plen_77_part_00
MPSRHRAGWLAASSSYYCRAYVSAESFAEFRVLIPSKRALLRILALAVATAVSCINLAVGTHCGIDLEAPCFHLDW